MTGKEVDEEFIDDKIDEKLSEAYSEILEEHDIDSGDVRPEMKTEFDKAESKIKETTKTWIQNK